MLRVLSRLLLSERSAPSWQCLARRHFQRRKLRQVPIWDGDIVEVEYCTETDYFENYRILKEKLITEFADLIEIRGNPYGMPRRSAFEVLWRRGEDLQEELWSKYASGEPSTADATYGVTEVIVYDLAQTLKKYGRRKGRYIERFPSSLEEMDYYRDLQTENRKIASPNRPRWPTTERRVIFERRRT